MPMCFLNRPLHHRLPSFFVYKVSLENCYAKQLGLNQSLVQVKEKAFTGKLRTKSQYIGAHRPSAREASQGQGQDVGGLQLSVGTLLPFRKSMRGILSTGSGVEVPDSLNLVAGCFQENSVKSSCLAPSELRGCGEFQALLLRRREAQVWGAEFRCNPSQWEKAGI